MSKWKKYEVNVNHLKAPVAQMEETTHTTVSSESCIGGWQKESHFWKNLLWNEWLYIAITRACYIVFVL